MFPESCIHAARSTVVLGLVGLVGVKFYPNPTHTDTSPRYALVFAYSCLFFGSWTRTIVIAAQRKVTANAKMNGSDGERDW